MATKVCVYVLAVLAVAAGWVSAQIAPPVPLPPTAGPTAPASAATVAPEAAQAPGRLEQLELTYRDALQKRHRKLIDQYLLDLKAAQIASLSESEKSAYAAEIARINRLITVGGGIVEPPQAHVESGKPQLAAGQIPGQVFSLDPHETMSPGPAGATFVTLGEQAWKLSKLAAGTYQIVAEYACSEVPAEAVVEVTFAGQKIESPVATDMKTRDDETYLLMRLGRIELTEDVTEQIFTAKANGSTPWLHVERILVARVMRKPKAKP